MIKIVDGEKEILELEKLRLNVLEVIELMN